MVLVYKMEILVIAECQKVWSLTGWDIPGQKKESGQDWWIRVISEKYIDSLGHIKKAGLMQRVVMTAHTYSTILSGYKVLTVSDRGDLRNLW